VSALDGFYTTWDNARQTFGQGAPQPGADFDKSPQLTNLGSGVTAAAPGSKWSGAAATNYDKANADHQAVFGKLAELDKKIAQQVDQSAQVVATGRQNLDQVRQWVTDAANSVPPGKQRDMLLMQIANRGLGQLTEVVQKTNAESNTVAQNLAKLGPEFEAVKNEQKFGNGEKDEKGDVDALGGEEMGPVPPEQQAEEDVRASLEEGDQAAAGRVEEVLGQIKPYRELTPEQAAYLNEMAKQQSGMSVGDLKASEDRLGDKGHIVGDSWQLMTNDDVPRSAGNFDEQQKGGFDRLPQSVQEAIKSPVPPFNNELNEISAIVKDGNADLQTGTELDREMMRTADRLMDASLFSEPSAFNPEKAHFLDENIQNIFESAGRDHQIVHDHITGTHGDDGQDFMMDVATHEWVDDGKAAGSLFAWTNDTNGPEATIAAKTANVYAEFLGHNSGELLSIGGDRQIGDVNPELVKAFSTGLLPYQEELVTDQPKVDTPFNRIDDLKGSMDDTKGLFAVIDSQPDAAREWNTQAYQHAMDMQKSFADFAKDNPRMPAGDVRIDDMEASARMLGAIDGGISQETLSNIHNARMDHDQAQANAQEAYEFKKDILRSVMSYGRGGDLVTNTLADAFAGPPPEKSEFKFDKDGMVTDVGLTSNDLSIASQYTQAQYTVASEFVDKGNPHIDERFFDETTGRLKPPSQISESDWSIYDAQLTAAMAEQTHVSALMQKFNTTLGRVGGYEG
jgi:hypothetical protein